MRTNKRFLQTTIVDTVISNSRQTKSSGESAPSQTKRLKREPQSKPDSSQGDNHHTSNSKDEPLHGGNGKHKQSK